MEVISSHKTVIVSGRDLRLIDVDRVANWPGARVVIDPDLSVRVVRCSAFVDQLIRDGRVVYGITTGFATNKSRVVPSDMTAALQRNLIRSHSAGIGAPLSEPEVRAAMLVRMRSLAQGYSGVRMELINQLMGMLNGRVYPYVPCQGSVGSSGDLAPLSHIGLVMMGEGEVIVDGRRVPSAAVLHAAGLAPLVFAAKEGLAMNNGTSVMTGIAALATCRANRLMTLADIAAAMSLEGLAGSPDAFDDELHRIRRQQGQMAVAENIRTITSGSTLLTNFDRVHDVQDAYSLRCLAQVHGASRDSIGHATNVLANELNAVTDNPLIFVDREVVFSGGNFHGEPVAQAMDVMKIGLCELGNIAERRVAKMVDHNTSHGLPEYLTRDESGASSGMMIAQYAAASLVSENKVLAHPASVDSIPTGCNSEDHVSMGTIAARHCGWVAENVANVIAIELLCAAQAMTIRRGMIERDERNLSFSPGVAAAFEAVRSVVPELTEDRPLYVDIEAIRRIMDDGSLCAAVESVVGRLA